MPFDSIRGFVGTKSFSLNTGVARILNRLGVNDD